ncbi:hypothetical protein ACXR6G_17175 [Ancylomarina sp. YFZ004]
MTPNFIKNTIAKNLDFLSVLCESISYVGSCALEKNNDKSLTSDFDILLILKVISSVSIIEEYLKSIFLNKVCIIQGWGLVTFEQVGIPVIHLLADTKNTLKQRNTLFLNSVSKYSPVYGTSLRSYIDYQELTPTLLLHDGDGLLRHYKDLKNKDFVMRKWCNNKGEYECKSLNNVFSSLLDQIIYISLQAMRNYLRLMGYNIEFYSNMENLKIWDMHNIVHTKYLREIICIKETRKLIGDEDINIDELYKKSLAYLENLIVILSNNSSQ